MCCFDVSRFARMCEKPNGFLMCQKFLIFECVYCWLVCWFAGFLGGGDGRNAVCAPCSLGVRLTFMLIAM